jgi:hypothetical protein
MEKKLLLLHPEQGKLPLSTCACEQAQYQEEDVREKFAFCF